MSKWKREATGPAREGGQRVAGGSPWPLKIRPEAYLERYPDGPNADLARKVLSERGEQS